LAISHVASKTVKLIKTIF